MRSTSWCSRSIRQITSFVPFFFATLVVGGGAEAASLPGSGFPIEAVKVKSSLLQGSPIPEGSVRLEPEKMTATIEGEWGSKGSVDAHFPKLYLHIPATIPANVGIVASKLNPPSGLASKGLTQVPQANQSLSPEFKRVFLEIPVENLSANPVEFSIVLANGKLVPLTVDTSVQLKSPVVFYSPACQEQGLSLRKVDSGQGSGLFYVHCRVEPDFPDSLKVALHSSSDFQWKKELPAMATISDGSHTLEVTLPRDLKGGMLLSIDGGLASNGESKLDAYQLWREGNIVDHWYGHARFNEVIVFQSSGGNTYSAELSWNPSYKVLKNIAVVGNLGVLPLKNGTTNTVFMALDYQLWAAYLPLQPFILEVGGGAHTYLGQSWTRAVLSANVGWMPQKKWIRTIDRVMLGYSGALASDFTHSFRLGLGFAF